MLAFGTLAVCALAACGAASQETAKDRFNTPPVVAQHVSVALVSSRDVIHPGASLDAGLYFKLEKGWHVYWVNAGDSGEPPRVRWTLPAGITASPMQYPAPKRLPLGPFMDFGYEDEVLFPIALHASEGLAPGTALDLSAKVDWLVCRDVCVPGKAALKLPLAIADAATPGTEYAPGLIAAYQEKLPRPLPAGLKAVFAPTTAGYAIGLEFTNTLSTHLGPGNAATPGASPEFFPLDQNVISNPAPQTAGTVSNGLRLDLKKDQSLARSPRELHGVLILAGTPFEIHATPGVLPASTAMVSSDLLSILKASGLAFVGGLILNLMPCVFPVLFIKGLALVQSSGEERSRMRAHGWVYALGIVLSFWAVVAVLLTLRAGGHHLGWGFQFQSPTFLAVIALLLFFLGLSLAGMFEIGLTLTSAGGSLADRQGYAGSFFTGVLAMVVASPCAAPFMGAGIGFALAQPAGVTFAIFTALAAGLALPYLLLSFNPAWTRLLPRPGAWMEVLKQATSLPIFATVIWMVWLFAMNAGDNALFGLLCGFLLLAVAGWVMGRWPAQRVPSLIAAFVVIAAVALPVYALRKFDVPSAKAGAGAASAGGASATVWETFSPELVTKYRAAGRPVFVDFTASWCLSCQVNERVVLERADVEQRLRDSGVALLKADWTRHDDVIAQTLASLGRSGVPAYAMYPGDPNGVPEMLPEVLTPGIVFDALDRVKMPAKPISTSASN
ncbi:MAG TPA: thioredoxin family protein [Acidisarcina sp.]